jgi:predicted ABC-type sugar transport system permease subunit
MDKSCKLAFLIIFIIPITIVTTIAWLMFGDKLVNSKVIFGYLNGISIMIVPTLVVIALGLVIKHFFFKKG